MHEQSKSARRRYYDGAFHSRYFVGNGIDIGAGKDSLAAYAQEFAGIKSVRNWEKEDGDAQDLVGVGSNTLDFVHSSHCLEHMVDVHRALRSWIDVVKPGGYLVITVPDEDMYEQRQWPSIFNQDHKHTFTICKSKSWSPVSINVTDLCSSFAKDVSVERILLLRDFYKRRNVTDQTLHPNVESAIEFIWKKHEPNSQ